MKTRRVYCDTSAFGGVFDKQFAEPSKEFMKQIKLGLFQLVVCPLNEEEMLQAPTRVRELFYDMFLYAEAVEVTDESRALQRAYLEAKILTEKWSDDALHVAVASSNGCETIVSWNFKHIVHSAKIPLYNAVNILKGYKAIDIRTPAEVIRYEE